MKKIPIMGWFSRQKTTHILEFPERFNNVTVLIVDDSRTQLFAMEKILKSAGINTITAENGKQGILMARHKKPDLILMDIVMPEINGFQATRYLSRQTDTANIPIIIISGSTQESDKAWGLKLGAKDYMKKPVDKALLLNKIAYWLRNSPRAIPSTPQEQKMLQAI